MATTPKSENIAVWIENKLAANTTPTYHYDPDAVERIEVLTTSLLNSAYKLRYFVRQGDDRLSERATKSWDVITDFYVTAAYKYDPLNRDTPELMSGELPQTVANKLCADILNSLSGWADNAVGIENIEFPTVSRYEPVDGWVVVMVSCIVRWSFMEGAA